MTFEMHFLYIVYFVLVVAMAIFVYLPRKKYVKLTETPFPIFPIILFCVLVVDLLNPDITPKYVQKNMSARWMPIYNDVRKLKNTTEKEIFLKYVEQNYMYPMTEAERYILDSEISLIYTSVFQKQVRLLDAQKKECEKQMIANKAKETLDRLKYPCHKGD